MSITVYAGFKRQDGSWGYEPETLEAQAKFYSVLLDTHITQEDIRVFNEIRLRWINDQELGSAWWRVYDRHPLQRVAGGLCNIRFLERKGIELQCHPEDGSGSTGDKALMADILNVLDLNPEAVDLMDEMYWG